MIAFSKRLRKNMRKARGFTLIELMIVVAVMAVLLAIAYPSYVQYVRRANRSEAMDVLLRVATVQGQFMYTYGRYSTSLTDPKTAAGTGLAMKADTQKDAGDTSYYNITMTNNNGGYQLSAAPTGDQENDTCGTLTLNDLGAKGAVKDSAAVAGCW